MVSVNDMWVSFKSEVLSAIERFIPSKMTKTKYSPFLHYPLVPSSKKINIVNTGNQNPPEGGTWLPVFPILIFVSRKPADNAKMVNSLPWIDSSIKRLIRKRDKLYFRARKSSSPDIKNHYKRFRAHVQKSIRDAYWKHNNVTVSDILGLVESKSEV